MALTTSGDYQKSSEQGQGGQNGISRMETLAAMGQMFRFDSKGTTDSLFTEEAFAVTWDTGGV